MITKHDLLEAIAECQGTRSPNANTAIKLAAFYTILDHLEEAENATPVTWNPPSTYSFDSSPPNQIHYDGDSEFAKLIDGRNQSDILPVIDELMATIKVLNSRLYDGVMRKLS